MTRKTYRTAQGKTVDLGALMLNNENTRAVGNMKVNARGDLVDGWNKPIDRRTQQVQKQYDRQVTNVRDEPVIAAGPASQSVTNQDTVKPTKPKASKPEKIASDSISETVVETAVEPVKSESPPSGLAAAIARARQIKQEPLQSPSEIAKNRPGVARI